MDTKKTKKCSKCKLVKELSGFGKRKKGHGGLMAMCRICVAENGRAYLRTWPGAYTQLVRNSRQNAKARANVGRIEAAQSTLVAKDIKFLRESQGGRCRADRCSEIHQGISCQTSG